MIQGNRFGYQLKPMCDFLY